MIQKLSKEKVRILKEWLKFYNRDKRCPFQDKAGFDLDVGQPLQNGRFARCYCRDVCKVAFAKVVLHPDNTERADVCPCDVYSIAYVVRKVRAAIKENKS